MKSTSFMVLTSAFLIALCSSHQSQSSSASGDAQIAKILERFVTLKDKELGWQHFTAKLVAALNRNTRYSDFVQQLRFYSDVCKSGLASSVSKRALMLREYREDLPFEARTILSNLELHDLIEIVRAHAEVDSYNKGCEITY